jgi:RNAse (barnase) inhibitor barstar
MNKKILLLDGNRFYDVEGFYEEVERVFTKDLPWKPAPNLDAFNDLLYGDFGVYGGRESVVVIWKNIAKSREELGFETTKKYYEYRFAQGTPNPAHWERQLQELLDGTGQTLFEIIVEIIKDHKNIEFREA